jgi:hypothetical protein
METLGTIFAIAVAITAIVATAGLCLLLVFASIGYLKGN